MVLKDYCSRDGRPSYRRVLRSTSCNNNISEVTHWIIEIRHLPSQPDGDAA